MRPYVANDTSATDSDTGKYIARARKDASTVEIKHMGSVTDQLNVGIVRRTISPWIRSVIHMNEASISEKYWRIITSRIV